MFSEGPVNLVQFNLQLVNNQRSVITDDLTAFGALKRYKTTNVDFEMAEKTNGVK